MSDEKYIDIPGSKLHELPPLLVHSGPEADPATEANDLASVMLEAEEMLAPVDAPPETLEERKFELALQLKEQYASLVSHWLWGDSILEWIRQCEITFENEETLRRLLHPDIWPHASRASFVDLLRDKQIQAGEVAVDRAVGLRLTFRLPPPIDCVSNQFLIYLNSTVATSAYRTWSRLSPPPSALFPPERFHFEVLDVGRR